MCARPSADVLRDRYVRLPRDQKCAVLAACQAIGIEKLYRATPRQLVAVRSIIDAVAMEARP